MKKIILFVLILICCLGQSNQTFAHCDSRKGPVVKAAREALATGNVNLVLVWVQPEYESELKGVFAKVVAARKVGKDVQILADDYFFETVVRLHRLGEGESYKGLNDEDPEPAILQAESALKSKSANNIIIDLSAQLRKSLDLQILTAATSSIYDPNNVKAGREHVANYVNFLHYVEALYAVSSRHVNNHKHELTPGAVTSEAVNHESTLVPANNQFYLLLTAAFISLAVLMIVFLVQGKKWKYRSYKHDF